MAFLSVKLTIRQNDYTLTGYVWSVSHDWNLSMSVAVSAVGVKLLLRRGFINHIDGYELKLIEIWDFAFRKIVILG